MMIRTQFSLQTKDGIHMNVYKWERNSDVRGVIQIAHGMAEHILRYEPFCKFLTSNGFIVYGNDHRGHGGTIALVDDKGFFAESNGFEKVVHDMKLLSDEIKKEYPHLPLFLFGHSMGSFLTRRYIQLFQNNLAGVILSGTGKDKGLIGKIGLLIAKLEVKRRGARTPSPFLDKLTFGNYNKKFKPTRTKFDFLSRDTNIVDQYVEDELCGFICTAGFFVDLIYGLDLIHRKEEMEKVPYALPIFLIAGDQDPVGDNGKGVQNVFEQFNKRCEYVEMKLYKGARHEVLNEINRDEVYDDILQWLHQVLKERGMNDDKNERL